MRGEDRVCTTRRLSLEIQNFLKNNRRKGERKGKYSETGLWNAAGHRGWRTRTWGRAPCPVRMTISTSVAGGKGDGRANRDPGPAARGASGAAQGICPQMKALAKEHG